jgi:hypothetical protein
MKRLHPAGEFVCSLDVGLGIVDFADRFETLGASFILHRKYTPNVTHHAYRSPAFAEHGDDNEFYPQDMYL